jgi:hypothetical protein
MTRKPLVPPQAPPEAERLQPLDKIGTVDIADLTERERLLLAMCSVYPVIPPPTDDEWRGMVGHLRFVMHRQRSGFHESGLTDQQSQVVAFANILGQFFMHMPSMKAEGLQQPLALLVTAFNDLAAGKISDLFKPVWKPLHRPDNQQIDDIVKGKAARALDLLIQAGESRGEAARSVAQALDKASVRGVKGRSPRTIINWRIRCGEGPGAVSAVALAHFRDPLPAEAGASAAEQAVYLLRELRTAPVIREPRSQ